MAEIKPALTNLRGPAARISSVMAETLPPGSAATVEMWGLDQDRHFKIGVPAGLAAPDAVVADEAVASFLSSPVADSHDTLKTLTTSRTGVVSAMDYGVVMDGSTDDTAAWQNLVSTVPRGTTILLPASPEGARWSKITDTIVITTDSISIVGPSSYMYNGGFVFEGVDKPMFRVDAAGVQFEKFSVIGRSKFGQDATYKKQVAVEFRGTVAGDIDASMRNCSFISFWTCVITRGRNLTMDGVLFGESSTAWAQLPKDATYHDMTQPNIVRGNIAHRCRFHNIGSATEPVVDIRDHTDYRHGSIESSYFDNNCMGVGVSAVGTSTAAVRGLSVLSNKFMEGTAGAVYMDYADTPMIANNQITGAGSASYNYDAIVLKNTASAAIESNSISRVGRHGIYLVGATYVSVLGNRIGQVGIAALGDGVAADSGCTGLSIRSLAVEGASGYGVSGSPTDASMSDVRLRATLGALDSTTLSMPASTLSATAMSVTTGSPAIGVVANYPVMLLDPTSAEGIAGFITPPPGATQVSVEVVCCTTTAGSGSVVLQVGRMIPDATMSDSTADTSPAFAVPTSANSIFRAVAHINTAGQKGPIGVRVIRIAANASDTYAYDIGVLAVRLVQTR